MKKIACSEKGFTLIELLIVIIIIGILAGVVITVINPTTQQNRAKDAVIRATMDKVGMVLASDYSASGSDPSFSQLMLDISGAVRCSDASVNGTGSGNSFIISGVDVNWKSTTYCTDGGFYLYTYAGQPICVGTYGYTGYWYAVNREGKVKATNAAGVSMYNMCQDLASYPDAN